MINIGTLNERTVAAMVKAGKKANALGHPVILDPVGAGAPVSSANLRANCNTSGKVCSLISSATSASTPFVVPLPMATVLISEILPPIMADEAKEVEDITSICNSLVINIGTLNERTVAAMVKAGKKANTLGHPVRNISATRNHFPKCFT